MLPARIGWPIALLLCGACAGGDASSVTPVDGGPASGATSGSGGMGAQDPCGDGERDLATEECDDPDPAAIDGCSATCRVRDIVVAAPAGNALGARCTLGSSGAYPRSRHPVAATDTGFAVAVSCSAGSDPAGPAEVGIRSFDATGARLGDTQVLSATTVLHGTAAIAGLPGGQYVAVWAGANGVVIQAVGPTSPGGTPTNVSDTGDDPDVLWTGSAIVVIWRAGDAVLARTFDTSLAPTSSAQPISDSLTDTPGHLTLTRLEGWASSTWAAAWRTTNESGEHAIGIYTGDKWALKVGPGAGPEQLDAPALVMPDAAHLALVYTETVGDEQRLQGYVFDASGSLTGFDIPPVDASRAQVRPALVRIGSRVFVAWEERPAVAGSGLARTWLAELEWDDSSTALALAAPPVSLPRQPGEQGDESPALALAPVGPEGSLVSAWVDLAPSGRQPSMQVRGQIAPLPLLRLGP
jgi:cysteine-rich repeat protein